MPPPHPEPTRAAFHGTVEERRAIAALPGQKPEILVLLAADADAGVRRAVAENAGAPPHADRLLAQDADAGIRAPLARKLAARAPELLADETEGAPRRGRLARDALLLLAQDVEACVRAALADVLADLPDAPRELVLLLARDTALEVCEPLIRLSRALTEEDLESLVEDPPGPATREAVARRLHLPARIARALVRCGEPAPVAALLRNGTAQLTPEMLHSLAARARAVPWLGEAICARPGLPAPLLSALLPALAKEALERLSRRPDLPPALRATVKERLSGCVVWSH
ncbi:DUF2336 domain-containing protein [Roseococcus sp. DSY-14]|uniref:DUF2336 domain-containing protein n=1 Tax=Roseococcus sp. DSY-14 TaxID=3369650 RepID=UPI00387B3040